MEDNKIKTWMEKKSSKNEQEKQDREFMRLEKLAAAINALNEQKTAANKFTTRRDNE
jgi:hypothetical protein